MATTRPFAYNTGSTIDGTTQIGNLAIGVSDQDYSQNPGGVKWWMGPDEELGYVIAHEVATGDHPTQVGVDAYLGFWRSTDLTDQSFLDLVNVLPITEGLSPFTDSNDAKIWLNNNGFWASYGENQTTPLPTSTSLPTVTPTSTPTNTPTPTATDITPTSTPAEPTPTATETPVGPTPTATDVPPTATPVPTSTPTETPVEPTPTDVPPTSTPVPTPTATDVSPTPTPTTTSGLCSGIRYNLSNIYQPPISGDTLWVSSGVSYSNEVNKLAIAPPTFISRYDSDGIDRLTYFGNLTGNTFTMTVCQDENSAVYSGITGTISFIENMGEDYFNVDGTKLSLVQSSPVSAFTYNQSVYYDFSIGGLPTPTPTPTATDVPPTPTPTATEVPPTSTPTETPTPTPTATDVPATSTPTPTPTSELSGVGSWYFYSDAAGAFDAGPPISSGNTIFTINTGTTIETFNPNKIDGVSYLYFNLKDSSGADYTTQFTGYTGGTGTITISQNGDTATYTSTTSGSFTIENIGGGTFFKIDTSLCTQTKTSNASYVYADPISIAFNSLSSTPTPTPGGPTSTPTPTPTGGGSNSWYFYTPFGNQLTMPPLSNGQTVFYSQAGGPLVAVDSPNNGSGQVYLMFYKNDSTGTSYETQFGDLMATGGTINVTQNGQTATYTSNQPGTFYLDNGGFLVFNAILQTVTVANPFNYTDPISLSFS